MTHGVTMKFTHDIILTFEEGYTDIWRRVYYALCLTISEKGNLWFSPITAILILFPELEGKPISYTHSVKITQLTAPLTHAVSITVTLWSLHNAHSASHPPTVRCYFASVTKVKPAQLRIVFCDKRVLPAKTSRVLYNAWLAPLEASPNPAGPKHYPCLQGPGKSLKPGRVQFHADLW